MGNMPAKASSIASGDPLHGRFSLATWCPRACQPLSWLLVGLPSHQGSGGWQAKIFFFLPP
jgi:hypothetical protein